jgi:hypothetical protein
MKKKPFAFAFENSLLEREPCEKKPTSLDDFDDAARGSSHTFALSFF